MKWAREVIIVGTSLLGEAMAGMSLAKLGGLADFPYGIGLSAGFAALWNADPVCYKQGKI